MIVMRKNLISIICISVLSVSVVLSGCQSKSSSKNNSEVSNQTSTLDEDETDTSNISKFEIDPDYTVDELDYDYDEAEVVAITLNGDNISCKSSDVKIDGSTITIQKAGTYLLSGTLTDGNIIVDSDDKENVRLIFNGVEISNSTTTPLFIKNAEKTIVTLVDGTENTLSDSENYILDDENNNEPNGTIFSKDDLVINGLGSLTINANYNHGIQSKNLLKIISGNIDIISNGDSIIGKDGVIVKEAVINIESQEDGIKATKVEENKGYIYLDNPEITIKAKKDGIQAVTCLYVKDGKYNIETGETNENSQSNSDTSTDYSRKGMKAGVDITIENGEYTIDSEDDGIHSNNSITVNAGTVNIASKDDGVHADTELTINNGDIKVSESDEGLEAKYITINDGNIDITSSDDGINASSGSSTTLDSGNAPGAGNRPEMPTNENGGADTNTGNRPEMPANENGEVDTNAGNRPEMPANENSENTLGNNSRMMPGGGRGGFAESDGSEFVINGGIVHVNAGGDGIDSNGTITINGGEIYVDGPTSGGDGALDYADTCKINGGILVAAGSIGMATAPTSGSTQYSVNTAFSKTYNGGTKVTVKDSSGNEVLTYTPAKNFQSFVFSTDKLKSGETYTIYAGDTQEGTFTVSDITTTVGNVSSGMGGGKPGSMQGGRPGKNSETNDNTNNTGNVGNTGNTQNNSNNKVTNSNSNQA
ncbi:MAG: carbohydrate-binding domain-containing protein [Clostridiales bacterium]|nr:carbohydrate-binding domain-containing protein [Clostridiales bacterium]